MRRIRTAMLLATAASLLVAFAVPAMAQASNWKKEGKELPSELSWYENGAPIAGPSTVTVSGPMSFSDLGTCPETSTTFTLVKGGGKGWVSNFSAGNLENCIVEGLLAELGCDEFTSVVPEKHGNIPWVFLPVKKEGKNILELRNFVATYNFNIQVKIFREFGLAAVVEHRLAGTTSRE